MRALGAQLPEPRLHHVREDLVQIARVSGCFVLVQRHDAHRNGFSSVFPGTGRPPLETRFGGSQRQ